MKFAFIEKYREEFLVHVMCRVLEVSKSGFYSWQKQSQKSNAKAQQRYKIARTIEDIHRSSRKSYGSPRVFKQLKALGFKISKTSVERIMREENIFAKSKKKFRVTTDSKHNYPIACNLLNRNFSQTTAPNQIWLTDITYLATQEGWLYLAAVMDLHTRKIVGWSIKPRMEKDLVIDALEMAVKRENPKPGLMHHSDRGSQYASHAYQQRLWCYGMTCSMSRKGNCWDNSPMESFFKTLKVEHVYHEIFATKDQARTSIFEWIEVFYNRQRIHSSLGYKSPVEFERETMLKAA